MQDPELPAHRETTPALNGADPPEAEPEALLELTQPSLSELPAATPPGVATALEQLYGLLQQAYKIDFSHYKSSTVSRRIERRLLLRQFGGLEEYVAAVRVDTAELDALYKDLLIGVTHFFRDPDAFGVLENNMLPRLLDRPSPDDGLRVWVAGCATGEEAYSIAILLQDAALSRKMPFPFQIFATDAHRESLELASQGIYPEASVAEVAPSRLERYFTRHEGLYRISPEIRRHVAFARQDLIKDPPFTKIDLIACRNLLIYFKPLAQRKALNLFHLALNPGGILFLGPSETVGELAGGFESLDAHWKIFQKQGVPDRAAAESEERYSLNAECQNKIGELTQSNSDMDNLLSSTDIGTVFLDNQLRIRKITPAVSRSLNLRPQDVGRPMDQISSNLDHPGLMDDLRGVLATGLTVEREVRSRSGAWLQMRMLPFRTENSASEGVVLTITDISILRRAQEALRQSEANLSQLAEFVKGVFWLTSLDGREIYYVSPGYELLWKRPLEVLHQSPQSWQDAIHPDDRARVERTIRTRPPEEGWEEQYRIVQPDGTVRWIRDRRYPVRDAEGNPFRLAGFTVDITSLRHSERMLEFSQFAVDNAGDLVFWIAPQGTFLYVNEAACVRLGYKREELLTKTISDVDLKRTLDAWPKFKTEVQLRERMTFESLFQTRDGRSFPVEISSTCLHYGNEVVYCSIARDISARKQAERDLEHYAGELERANESLRHHNRELDEFAHLASHDLKEPLRAILTFSQLLEQDLGAELPEDARRDLEFITNSAARMQRLINDLLALSRAGRADMRQTTVALASCVKSALQALSMRIRETGADIQIDELPEVTGDVTMLTQLYQNLIGNALKFSSPDQKPCIQITASRGGEGRVFGVKDNGIGIKREYLEKVFQPFRRLHVAPNQEGTGIGLAICRKVVERHGGRIWVDSQPGEGAFFQFTLGESGSGQ